MPVLNTALTMPELPLRAASRRMPFSLVITSLLLLAACSPATQEDTPEPGQSAKIKELADRLGIAPSWTDKLTGAQTERADGVILYDWIRRRQATLEGKLGLHHAPALTNPGKIADTLAWERRTQADDRKGAERFAVYSAMLENMRSICRQVVWSEAAWLANYKDVHAAGAHEEPMNWDVRAASLQIPCAQEKDGSGPIVHAGSAASPANSPFTPAEQQFIRRRQDAEATCRGSYDEQESARACREQDIVVDQMNAAGLCWGREDEVQAEYTDHRCAPGSIGYRP